MLKPELFQAIREFCDGTIVFEELRAVVLREARPTDIPEVFANLPQDAVVGLVNWLSPEQRSAAASLPHEDSTTGFTSEGPNAPHERLVLALRSHVEATTSWLDKLDLTQAAHNVRSDTFGDWIRDPWGWPELEYYANAGRTHVLARASQGPTGVGIAFDVPKNATESRPALILDLLDRVLYQACADQLAVNINTSLPAWVFGWRLPPGRTGLGHYARNDFQWNTYVQRLRKGARSANLAFRSDVTEFFASLALSTISDAVASLADAPVANSLIATIAATERNTGRHGLPQRSSASSVIANAVLAQLDEAVSAVAPTRVSLARWVDDLWAFGSAKDLERIEGTLRNEVTHLGLLPNESKTGFFEGAELHSSIDRLNFSYIEDALDATSPNFEPLEAAVETALAEPSLVTRHELMFLTTRIKQHNHKQLCAKLAENALLFPQGADLFASMFKRLGLWRDLRTWYAQLLSTNASEWTKAAFLRMIPLDEPGSFNAAIADALYTESTSSTATTYLRIAALSRTVRYSRDIGRDALKLIAEQDLDAPMRRAVGFCATLAGYSKPRVRRILLADRTGVGVAGYLDSIQYSPKAITVFA